MDINEYAQRKSNILGRMLAALFFVLRQFITPFMTRQAWNVLMHVVYRVIKPFRDEATELSRQFYDDNRASQTGETQRHDIFTDDYFPEEWMRETLEPTFRDFQKTRNAEGALTDISNRLIKVVEDAQRRTLIRGVETDTSQPVKAWARFDPRPPTCAFCTMMISRGPVYQNSTAGSKLDDLSAAELWEKNDTDAMNEMMNKWHPGCTCVVVPVYSTISYPTQHQEDEAFEIYKEARKRAKAKGDVSFKAILKEMRTELYSKVHEQDEVSLSTVA
jgi:hypothetical protein